MFRGSGHRRSAPVAASLPRGHGTVDLHNSGWQADVSDMFGEQSPPGGRHTQKVVYACSRNARPTGLLHEVMTGVAGKAGPA